MFILGGDSFPSFTVLPFSHSMGQIVAQPGQYVDLSLYLEPFAFLTGDGLFFPPDRSTN
jgi:hypothetical protein